MEAHGNQIHPQREDRLNEPRHIGQVIDSLMAKLARNKPRDAPDRPAYGQLKQQDESIAQKIRALT